MLAYVLACSACDRACRTPQKSGGATSYSEAWLLPDLARLDSAPPELQRRLQDNPHALFRFVNHAWMRQVCAAFSDELRSLPAVRLHGDAHIEQYAVTANARGLDDFDDSAIGPSVIDLVRFLGSVELTAHQHGWGNAIEPIATEFFRGYRQALGDPAYLPPDPAVVTRLRAAGSRTPAEFMAWAESLMQPMSAEDQASFETSWSRLEAYARKADSSLTPTYLRVKREGWLKMGIGSALSRKLLARVEGETDAPEDDQILEAKQVRTLSNVPCLDIPASGEVLRVVEGITQIGRVRHGVLVVVPAFPTDEPDIRGWWVKSWEPSYRELEIADLGSPQELIEVAHDVGAQLGSTNLRDADDSLARQKRLMELESVTRLEPLIRQVAHGLSLATLGAWQRMHRQTAQVEHPQRSIN